MKPFVLAAACAVVVSSGAALAQHTSHDMKAMDTGGKAAAATAPTHQATGVVQSVDQKAGMVMVSHDAIASLNWPPMTMGFQVKDRGLLDKLAVNRKVRFDFRQDGANYLITAVR